MLGNVAGQLEGKKVYLYWISCIKISCRWRNLKAKLWIYSYIFITYTHIFILALTETMVMVLM